MKRLAQKKGASACSRFESGSEASRKLVNPLRTRLIVPKASKKKVYGSAYYGSIIGRLRRLVDSIIAGFFHADSKSCAVIAIATIEFIDPFRGGTTDASSSTFNVFVMLEGHFSSLSDCNFRRVVLK